MTLKPVTSEVVMNLLIVQCSSGDTEMAEMATAIRVKRESAGDRVECKEFSDIATRASRTKFLEEVGRPEQLIIVGHSRFFASPEGMAVHDYTIIPLMERKIGDYSVDVILPFLQGVILDLGIQEIMFCCCEVATSLKSHKTDNGGAAEVLYDFGGKQGRHMELAESGGKLGEFSLLSYIVWKLRECLSDKHYFGEVVLKGLNGVGYIAGEDPRFLSFSQEYLYKYKTLAKKGRATEGNDEFMRDYVLHRDRKKSAHVLGFTVKPGE